MQGTARRHEECEAALPHLRCGPQRVPQPQRQLARLQAAMMKVVQSLRALHLKGVHHTCSRIWTLHDPSKAKCAASSVNATGLHPPGGADARAQQDELKQASHHVQTKPPLYYDQQHQRGSPAPPASVVEPDSPMTCSQAPRREHSPRTDAAMSVNSPYDQRSQPVFMYMPPFD